MITHTMNKRKPNKPSNSRLPPYYEIVHIDYVDLSVTLENRPPYPRPERINNTKKRCQYHLYKCRAIGCYKLNGKRYCGAHYDIAWKIAFPVCGQQHDWHHKAFGNGDPISNSSLVSFRPMPYESCRKCGIVKPRANLPVTPCRGKLPFVITW